MNVSYDDWHNDSQSFAWRQHRVAYRRMGAGTPLLLLHGFPTSGWDWSFISNELSQQFELIIPDLLDSGQSRNILMKNADIDDQVQMITALLESLEIESIHILAHDAGNHIAQEMIARQVERRLSFKLLSAAYLNGNLLPDEKPIPTAWKPMTGLFSRLKTSVIDRSKILSGVTSTFAEDKMPDDALANELWAAIRGTNGRSALRRRVRIFKERQAVANRLFGALKSRVPQQFIIGMQDPDYGRSMAERISQRLPTMPLQRIAAAGRYPHIETPQDTVEAFMAFHQSLNA